MRYVIDTNIWIYLLEGRLELSTLTSKMAQGQIVPVLTPVVFTEVLGWQELGAAQEQEIRKYFATLDLLMPTMQDWEQIISWRKQGIKQNMPDLLIAAQSKKSGYPILTRNLSDFNRLGVVVENPWEERDKKSSISSFPEQPEPD